MMHYIVSSLVILMLVVLGDCKPTWKDCGSKLGSIKDVQISGCETVAQGSPCPLHHNTNATVTIDFQNKDQTVSKLTTVVHGIIAEVPVPFPVDNPNACQNCGLTCPLKPNTSYSYKTSLAVKGSYPKIKLVVKWELQDSSESDLVCFAVLVEIVD